MSMLDKSRGFAFSVSAEYLSHPVKFYNGLYSSGSYAGVYKKSLVYLSGVMCKTFPGGREKAAKFHLWRLDRGDI